MKKFIMALCAVALMLTIVGCGTSTNVGKIQTQNGNPSWTAISGVIPTSLAGIYDIDIHQDGYVVVGSSDISIEAAKHVAGSELSKHINNTVKENESRSVVDGSGEKFKIESTSESNSVQAKLYTPNSWHDEKGKKFYALCYISKEDYDARCK